MNIEDIENKILNSEFKIDMQKLLSEVLILSIKNKVNTETLIEKLVVQQKESSIDIEEFSNILRERYSSGLSDILAKILI